jgi:transketolase
MGLEDISLFGTIPDSVVLQPADAFSAAKLVPLMINHKGFVYMRTLRPKTMILYENKEEFKIGGSKILRQSNNDTLTVAATGITVFEAIKAADELKKEGINICVIDCYSIKPVDAEALKKCLRDTKKKIIVTVEDHFEHGGMGDFAEVAISAENGSIEKMAVSKISQSGTKDQLLDDACINAKHIMARVKELIK